MHVYINTENSSQKKGIIQARSYDVVVLCLSFFVPPAILGSSSSFDINCSLPQLTENISSVNFFPSSGIPSPTDVIIRNISPHVHEPHIRNAFSGFQIQKIAIYEHRFAAIKTQEFAKTSFKKKKRNVVGKVGCKFDFIILILFYFLDRSKSAFCIKRSFRHGSAK
jgi:hypothetical protein